MFDRNPDRPTEDIMNDIGHAAQQHRNPALVFISFSALLLKLSGQANQANAALINSVDDLKAHITYLDEKNGKLQTAVTWLTIVSVGLALLQVVLAALPYWYPAPSSSPPTAVTTPQRSASEPSAVMHRGASGTQPGSPAPAKIAAPAATQAVNEGSTKPTRPAADAGTPSRTAHP